VVGFFDLWVVYILCLIWVAILARNERSVNWVRRWPLAIGAGLAAGILLTMMGVAFQMNQPATPYGEVPTQPAHPLATFSEYGIHIATGSLVLGIGWLIAATARALSSGGADPADEDSTHPESA